MKLKYLGTAAAEGYPGIFCSCQYCKRARLLGGKNLRTRSQSIIDNHLLIDFPADSYSHILQNGLDFSAIHSLLITHTHQDHLYLEDLGLRFDPFSHNVDGMLTLYGNDALKRKFHQFYNNDPADTHLKDKLDCVELTEFLPVMIEEYQVTPLLADHDKNEKCFIYLIEHNNHTLLYGNDTGWFPDATWDYLKDKKIDCLSLDCTCMKYKNHNNHLGLFDCLEVINKLESLYCINSETKLAVTHFSHNGELLHDEMSLLASQYGIKAAYDGFEITF